jgi:RNA polymerase sigma factor (sigma-70 family)
MPRLNPHLLTTLGMGVEGPTDAEFLTRFITERDSGAFELLVWRHASVVLRVCRSVLRDRHEAEDAAQATFLALARQARSIHGANIAGWLFRVARRVSMRSARRLRKQCAATDIDLDQLPAPAQIEEANTHLELILQEELVRLPERYQLPILLCFFEGHTYTEAAQRLGCPVGTIAGRVSRAKRLLEPRLARRGVSLAGLVCATIAIPPTFARSTASTAMAFAQGNASVIKKTVLELATLEVRGMFAMKAVRYLGVLLCGVLALRFGWATEPPTAPVPHSAPATQQKAAPKPPAAVVGKTFVIAPVTTKLQRRLLPDKLSSVAVVLLDGMAMFPEPKTTFDLDAIDFKGVEKGLAEYRPAADRGVYFITNFPSATDLRDKGTRTGIDLLNYAWEGVGRKAGFGRALSSDRFSFDSWDDWVAPLRENTDATAEEVGSGDDRVRAYPVRTPLSRVLTGKVDAVVDISIELNPTSDDWIPAEVGKSVNAAIAALKLEKGKKLGFYFYLPKRGEGPEITPRIQKTVIRWATEHGLEYGNLSY